MFSEAVQSSVNVPAWVIWVLVVGALLGSLKVVVRTTPVTWLTRQIAETLTQSIREVVRAETGPMRDELMPNGGTTLRDAIDRVEHEVGVTKDTLEEHVATSVEDRRDLRLRLEIMERMKELDADE